MNLPLNELTGGGVSQTILSHYMKDGASNFLGYASNMLATAVITIWEV